MCEIHKPHDPNRESCINQLWLITSSHVKSALLSQICDNITIQQVFQMALIALVLQMNRSVCSWAEDATWWEEPVLPRMTSGTRADSGGSITPPLWILDLSTHSGAVMPTQNQLERKKLCAQLAIGANAGQSLPQTWCINSFRLCRIELSDAFRKLATSYTVRWRILLR